MKKIFLTLLISIPLFLHAQQGVVATGGDAEDPGGTMSSSTGLADFYVIQSDQYSLQYGLQQTYKDADTYQLTLNLDMSTATGFDPGVDAVYVTGSFWGEWIVPGDDPDNQLMAPEGDTMMWTITLDLAPGDYEYKYFLNEGWDGGEWPGEPNRELTVTGDMVVNDTWGYIEPVEGGNIMVVRDATASTNGVVTIELEIINEDEFVGINLDIPLPDGFSYIDETAQLHRDDGHFFNFAIVESNVARMLSAAIPTKPFLGNDGVIVSFDLQTPATQGTYVFDIVDAVIADATGLNIMTGHVPGTVILEDMPDNLNLYDLFITDGMVECFSALISIITAGENSDFIIYNGGSVELIAGESIHMLPGTTVEYGGYLLARIAVNDDDYCGIPRAKEIAPKPVTSKEDVVFAAFPYKIRENGFFKLYPNPTDGTFTLELANAEPKQSITVDVYGMLGGRLFTEELPPQRLHTLSLKGHQPGIYIIRVMKGDNVGVERLIKR